MSIPPVSPQTRPPSYPHSRRRTSVWSLVGVILFVMFMAVLVLALLRFMAERSQPVVGWLAPDALGMLDVEQGELSYLLEWLAGMPDAQIVDTALDADEPMTAYALLLFAGDLDDRQRVEGLLKTAHAIRGRDNTLAARLYLLTGQMVVVNPFFDDATRAQILLETGDGLEMSRVHTAALRDWQQVSILARFAPRLSLAAREQILDALAARYELAGEPARAAAVREMLTGLDEVAEGDVRLPPLDMRPLPAPWPPSVLERVRVRQQIAREVQFAWQRGTPAPWERLSDAFDGEWEAIQQWLADPNEPNPFGRQERYRRWVEQMRLVSRGIMGPGRLPSWEARAEELDLIAARLWEQQDLEIRLAMESLSTDDRAVAERYWIEWRLAMRLLASDPLTPQEHLLVRLDQVNGAVVEDRRLRLVLQADDLSVARFWRLPIGYLVGEIPAEKVFR